MSENINHSIDNSDINMKNIDDNNYCSNDRNNKKK